LVGIVLVARSSPSDDLFALSRTVFLGAVFGWLVSRDSKKLDVFVPASIIIVGLALVLLLGDDAPRPVIVARQLQVGGLTTGSSASALLRLVLERRAVGGAAQQRS
jgi:hypothetical protein